MLAAMELLDYAETQGKANFDWHTKVNETTRQECNITLGFLIGGGGTALAWAIQHASGSHPNMPLATAVIVLGIWLFALAMALVWKCLSFVPSMAPANQPSHIYLPKFDTDGIREIQLQYLEKAIELTVSKGEKRALWLGHVRVLTCLSPLVFLAAWTAVAVALR